jgi:hypothetical protein
LFAFGTRGHPDLSDRALRFRGCDRALDRETATHQVKLEILDARESAQLVLD